MQNLGKMSHPETKCPWLPTVTYGGAEKKVFSKFLYQSRKLTTFIKNVIEWYLIKCYDFNGCISPI